MRYARILALVPALMLFSVPTPSQAAVDVSVSVNLAPPAIPVYDQPPLPAPGYLWTPGYWAWDGMDYYWVPGTWVQPPASGLLWTPGYWSWNDGQYVWNPGYWGPEVGFYGGIDYGFGYGGEGYLGGYWHGGAFFYNRAVANFGTVNVVNVYTAPARRWGNSHVSFNGGQGGVRARPSPEQERAMHDRHSAPTPVQREHQEHAQSMPTLHARQNGGRPQILTTQRPADFGHPGPGLHNHAMAAPSARAAMRPAGEGPQIGHQEAQPQREGAMRGPGPESRGASPTQSGTQHFPAHEQSFHQPAPREVQQPHEQQQHEQQQREQQQQQQREQQQQQREQQQQRAVQSREPAQPRQQPQFHEQQQHEPPQHEQPPHEQPRPQPQAHEQAAHSQPPREGGHEQGRRENGPQRDH